MKQKKRIEIKSFINIKDKDEICCKQFYNYFPTEKLSNSIGFKTAEFPLNYNTEEKYELNYPSGMTKPEGISLFRQYFSSSKMDNYRLIVYGNDKKVYIHPMLRGVKDLVWTYSMTFENVPISLTFKKDDLDAVILTDGNQMKVWVTNYSPYTVENAPIITDMCMNEGVLFCCLKEPAFKLWYATDLDPEKVGGIDRYSGYISLKDNLGNANRVITLDENVYVIRDYGISKITIEKNEFIVSEVYSSNTKIYHKTACVCGNVLLFMTNDGLYTYNGVRVSKTDLDFKLKLENTSNMIAASLGEKYYLAYRYNFEDENSVLCENESFVNNTLLVLDTNNYLYQIVRGVDIKSLLPVKTDAFEKMLVLFNSGEVNKIGEIYETSTYFNENLPKLWKSEEIFSNFDSKMFTKLIIEAEKDVKIKLVYDDKEITFTTYKSGVNEFLFKIIGKQLKLEIMSSQANAEVKKVYLDYYDYW